MGMGAFRFELKFLIGIRFFGAKISFEKIFRNFVLRIEKFIIELQMLV